MTRRTVAQAPALAFVTLGCPKNTVDSEHMLGAFVADGFRTVADPADAGMLDVVGFDASCPAIMADFVRNS